MVRPVLVVSTEGALVVLRPVLVCTDGALVLVRRVLVVITD